MSDGIEVVRNGEPERKPEARIEIPNKKQAPDGFENIGLGKEVSLTIKGKVRSLSVNEWDGGSMNMCLEILSMDVDLGDKKVALGDAIEGAKRRM